MQLFYLILSLLFFSGFDFVGKKTVIFLRINEIICRISNPIYQNGLIGISSFIFFMFPILFLGFMNRWFFISVSVTLLAIGFFNFFNNFFQLINFLKKKILSLQSNNLLGNFIIILIILYFLLSISPITSGDSVAYHLFAPKYLLAYGNFPTELYSVDNVIAGAGELLNAFAISINAYQFTSLINFIGLISVLAIVKKFSDNLKLNNKSKQFLFLCVLSCPVLIFLASSSKSQLFSVSLIFFSYALLVDSLNNKESKNNLFKIFFICTVFCIVAVQTKITFSLSFFLIILNFLFFFRKKIITFKLILVFSLLFIYGLIVPAVWKQVIYNYPFYNFLFNPVPMNIPGYEDYYLYLKNYEANKFPISLFIPISLSDLTQFLGFGLFLFFFLIRYQFSNKNILVTNIFIFVLILSYFQKSPRYYLEIYFLIILTFIFLLKKIQNTFGFKILKLSILFQSLFVSMLLFFGVYNLSPGILSENLYKSVLSKYAVGYNLYNWVNQVLPKGSSFITHHRSISFTNENVILFNLATLLDKADLFSKNFHLEKIKDKKPKFILFTSYGTEHGYSIGRFNFYKCTDGIFAEAANVGFHETRNPINTDHRKYNAYIYYFDYLKLPNCVSYN